MGLDKSIPRTIQACAETFWKEQEKVRPKNDMDIMKFDSIIPEYIFIEEYDGLQMVMKYIFKRMQPT